MSHALILRMLMTVIRAASTNPASVSQVLRLAVMGIMVAAACGALTVFAVATLILMSTYGLYLHGHLTQMQALLFISVCFISAIGVGVWLVFRALSTLERKMKKHARSTSFVEGCMTELVEGFMEGYKSPAPRAQDVQKKSARKSNIYDITSGPKASL